MMLSTLILSAMSLLSAFVGLGHGYVRTIGLTDGLSSQAVYALHQDAQGYMWAGTYEGLNRLDGRHVKVYRAGRDGHDRISGDIVERVHETLPGVLWIHSNFGLDCLDTRTGRIAYHPALNGSYRSTTAPDGTVLATNADGRCLYYHYGRRQFVPTPLPGVCFDSIRGFAIDGLRRLVVTQPSRTDVFALSTSAEGTTRLRLVRRMRVAGTCLAYAADWDGVQQLVADTAYNIYERTATDLHLRRLCQARPTAPAAGRIGGLVRMGHTLLVAYKGRGVMAIDLRTGARQLLPVHEGVNALVPDRRQPLVWMATDGGLLQYVYDRYRFLPMSFGQSGWTGAAVRAIYIDPHGDLWLGTRGNGLLRYDGARTTDGPSARYTTANSMLGHDMVFNIVPSAHRRLLWIGTEGEGLNYYSYRLQRVCRLRPRQWPMVRCIHYVVETGPDELWAVSNWNGLLHIWLKDTAGEPEIVSCQQLLYDDRRPGFAQFFTIRQQGHELWLANRENGVYCLDTRRSLLTHVLFVRPRASAANDVHTLCTDIPGHVLVGTSAGLLDIVRGHGRRLHVRNLSRRAALEGQAVRAITADGAHGLWAATAHGLLHVDLLNGSTRYHEVRPPMELADGAAWRCPATGICYFGATEGVMCVDENAAAPDRPYVPPVLFEGLDDGATLRPLHDFAHSHPFPHFGSFSHSCSDLCPSPDTDTRSISIAHDQTYLSLRLSAIDYLDAPGYSFEYRMGRTDTLWHRTVGGPLLSLVGLAPGTYRLAVRYRHGTVVSAPRTLTVRVLPPWWASPWAKGCYALLALVLAWGGVRLYRLVQRRRREREEQRRTQEAYRRKVRHMEQLSREMGTPLTLIDGPVRQMLKWPSLDEKTRRYMAVVSSNAERMKDLARAMLHGHGSAALHSHAEALGHPVKVAEGEHVKAPSLPYVMVVHGHAELLWMLADALGSCYNTVVCRSAGTARQWLLRRQPQLVVVGARRLDTDTVDFCRLLKGHRSTAHLPLVLLTSRDDTEADALAPITGADVRLTEPYDEADLLSVVSGLMQRAQVLKEYFETSASAFELVDGHVLHKDEKELLERIVAVINANITNPQLSTTFVARQLGIGTRNLYRQLAAFTHDTPTAIIRATRLERARRLLSHTTLTVEEIVYKAGFSNRSTFYTQFAQKFGCTPLEYQHRCREEGRRGMQDED